MTTVTILPEQTTMKPICLLYLFSEPLDLHAMIAAHGRLNADWFLGHAPLSLWVNGISGDRFQHVVDGYAYLIRVILGPAPVPGQLFLNPPLPAPTARKMYGETDLGRLLNTGRLVTAAEALAVCPGTTLADEVE